MKTTLNIKTKALWFIIGLIVAQLPYVGLLGKQKGLEDMNVMLTSVICTLPKEELRQKVNQMEIPTELIEMFGDNSEQAVQEIRSNLIKRCD